jgi:hypothetical protein
MERSTDKIQVIKYSGDGGMYAELIRNRGFQGGSPVSPFTTVGLATFSFEKLVSATFFPSAKVDGRNWWLKDGGILQSWMVGHWCQSSTV